MAGRPRPPGRGAPETPRPDGATPLPLAAGLFFVSGAAALVVETTWMRWLRELLGATAPAASATLVAFFGGQALGAIWGARRAWRSRRPLALYGALELAAAAWCLAVPGLLELGLEASARGYDRLLELPLLRVALRFGIALAATLPAAAAFGASFPALVSATAGAPGQLGMRGGVLYGLHTLGAAGGAVLAGFLLPPRLGVSGTYRVGLVALLAVGLVALLAVGRVALRTGRAGAPAAQPPRAAPTRPPRLALGLAAVSGFGVFAAEVLLVQAFGLVLNQSVQAFASVLVVVLGSLGLAALGVALLERRGGVEAQSLLGGALAASALALAAFPALFFSASGGLGYLGSDAPWPGYVGAALGLALRSAGPLLLLAGLVFPASLALAARAGAHPAAGAGGLLAANTVGAIAGALAAPYLLLPALGLWPAFAALAALYAGAALVVPARSPALRWGRDLALAGGSAALLLFASPLEVPLGRLAAGETLVEQRSTPAGLVSVVRRGRELLVRTDNHYALGGSGERIHEERQGHLPLLLHPAPRRVASVGAATGISAGAALLHPVERLTLVELVPGVAQVARRHFAPWNRGVYDHPRSRVVVDDARNFLRATGERFDVVIADLFVPWRSGTGSLYTAEHFTAVRGRLREGGLFCQWLPLYQLGPAEFETILATFLDVFPRAGLFRGDFYGAHPIAALVGFRDAAPPAPVVSEAAERLARTDVRDRWVTDPVGVWALYAGPLSPLAPSLAAVPRNSDDRPRVEFLAARRHAEDGVGKDSALVGLRWLAVAERVHAEGARDPLFPDLGAAARRGRAGGLALQRAGALYVAGRPQASGRAFAEAAALLPARLVAEAEADPSAAEVWSE